MLSLLVVLLVLKLDLFNLLDIYKVLEASKVYSFLELKKEDDLLILLKVVNKLLVITKLPRSLTRF